MAHTVRALAALVLAFAALGAAPAPEVTRMPRPSPGTATFDGAAWPGGIVPYNFASGVNAPQQAATLDAIAEIEAVCGVNFVPRTGQADYVTIRPNPSTTCSNNCSFAAVGMQGGQQFVSIGSNHWTQRYIVVHEFLHALGFRHEHQRPGRNTFVTVNWQNISQTLCNGTCDNNFNVAPTATAFGPYDFASIMHYGQSNFSIGNTLTLVPKPAYAAQASVMGNRLYMTLLDAAGLQAVYGPPAAPTISNIAPGFMVLGVNPPTLTITGSRFFEGSPNNQGVQGTRVRWNGAPVAVTYVSPTQVQLQVTNAMVAAAGPGCVDIQVENPAAAGGGSSSVAHFNIIDIVPTVDLWNGVWQNENLGQAVAGIRDVDGDGHDDVVVGVPGFQDDDGRVACHSGATGATLWLIAGPADSQMGRSLAAAGDVDGDGIEDVLVGAPGYSNGRGRMYILRGQDGSTIRTRTGSLGDTQAAAVAWAGDVNGDGVPDQVVGAPLAASLAGLARVYSGSNGALLFTLNGQNAGDQFGAAVGGGYDLGGNGQPDVVVGAPYHDGNGTNSGRIRAYSGQTGGPVMTRDGDGANDHFGFSVALIPSTVGSASGHVLVGAPEPGNLFGNGTGAGYVRIFGPAPAVSTVATLNGDAVGDRFGGCVANAGDLDQDGHGDFIVGAWQGGTIQGPTGPGYIRIFAGDGLRVLSEVSGSASGDRFGRAAARANDVDGDGRGDVIVGAPGNDATCPGAGQARVLHPPVPPAFGRLLISEVTWDNPDGVEVTNFGSIAMSLGGWRLMWDDGPASPKVADLSGMLQPGESMIVKETSGNFAEAPAGAPLLTAFPSIGTTTADFTVVLVHPNGTVTDGVRIASLGGTHAEPGMGELFRGLALRSAGAVGVERIWGLDSNAGADWTAETTTSMGRINRGSGPRGTDPVGNIPVIMTEVDDSPDYVEIRSLSPAAFSLQHWFFLADATNGGGPALIRPWPTLHLVGFGGIRVIGDNGTAPAELPVTTPYFALSAVSGGNIPFITTEWSLGLYDSYGRVVDLVCAEAESGPVVHNTPRLPAHWSDFTGGVPRTTSGDRAVGRVGINTDSNSGADWRAVTGRTMGAINPLWSFSGPLGLGDLLDVRVEAPTTGGIAFVINAGTAQAGSPWFFLVSAGHGGGQGPIFGMALDSLTNFETFGTTPPFTGVLDARGSARLDLDLAFPPGVALDTLFFLLGPGGTLGARTLVLEFDS